MRPIGVISEAARCFARTVALVASGRLHLRTPVQAIVSLPDGRTYTVFRESTCDGSSAAPVLLSVWFHLRGVPAGATLRRRLFERLCIVNTVLFAGFDGYLVKLSMVDPATSDYAGLYSWSSATEAEHYGRYITAMLQPLSTPGSVGYEVDSTTTLDDYLARQR